MAQPARILARTCWRGWGPRLAHHRSDALRYTPAMSTPPHYRFDPFVLLTDPPGLLCHDSPVTLQSKPLELLSVLVAAEGRLVPRETLFSEVWPEVHVSDASLAQAMRKLPKALKAASGEEPPIVTVPGQGYRFDAPVRLERPVQVTLGNLGADPGDILGRSDERVAVETLVRDHRLVTIVGPGGIGKTTLGFAVSRAVAPGLEGGA